jgi:membrane fusion protein
VKGQLFRQEALVHQSERHWGECSHSSPVGMGILTILILMLVFSCCWFLVTGEYHRKTRVSGVLVSDRGTVQIRAPTEGIVEKLSVGQGERVGIGETLLIIRQGLTALDGNALGSKLLNENLHQQELIKQLIDAERESHRVKVLQLHSEMISLERQKSWMENFLANEEKAGELLKHKYHRLMSLGERNLVAVNDIEASRFDWLKQDSQVQQLRLDLESILKTLSGMNNRKRLLALEQQQQVVSLENDLTELHKQHLQRLSEQVVRLVSPVKGHVSVINTQSDQSVITRQVLLSVVQENSALEAELFIPSRAIGFVELGQVVNLRIDAYSYQKYGMQRATISEVSQTILLPAETGGAVGIKEPFYKVKAKLDESIQVSLASQVILKPGMQFSAEIVLENRSLLEWLLEPLFLHASKL